MSDRYSTGGKARAAGATRGDAGQFLPASTQRQTQREADSSSTSSSRAKPLTLKTLHTATEWWEALAAQYPTVDLHKELLKAMDWHRADRVKSPKLFFRNWVENAARWNPEPVELTHEQIKARMRIVS